MRIFLTLFFVFSFISIFAATSIDSCQTLSSGSYIINVSEITSTGNCFVLNSDTIELNCNGSTIIGDGSGDGIRSTVNRNYINITNCNIANFNNGIIVDSSDQLSFSIIENVSIQNISNNAIQTDFFSSTLENIYTNNITGFSIRAAPATSSYFNDLNISSTLYLTGGGSIIVNNTYARGDVQTLGVYIYNSEILGEFQTLGTQSTAVYNSTINNSFLFFSPFSFYNSILTNITVSNNILIYNSEIDTLTITGSGNTILNNTFTNLSQITVAAGANTFNTSSLGNIYYNETGSGVTSFCFNVNNCDELATIILFNPISSTIASNSLFPFSSLTMVLPILALFFLVN